MESKLIPCDDRTCKCSDSYGICRADEPYRKPPMTPSEPTTGEIVRILRGYADDIRARAATDIPTPPESIAADLLEGYKRVVVDRDREIADLTARAESAERERDAAIKDTRCGGCTNCQYHHYLPTVQRHEKCKTCRDRSNYEWRGLPQDGEGK